MKLIPTKSVLLSLGLFSKFESHSGHDEIPEKYDGKEPDDKWQRLKKMYSFDKYGNLSPQFLTITEGSLSAFIIGFAIGSINDSKETYIRFIEENQATAYRHHIEAKRMLQDAMTKSIMKGGWRVGWRLSLITTSMLLALTSINTYNGKTSIVEFTSAGALTCGIYKFQQGFKPFISGTVVGGVLGTMVGGIMIGLMKLTGTTLEDIYEIDANRIDKYHEKKQNFIDETRVEILEKFQLPYERLDENQNENSKSIKEVSFSNEENNKN